MKRSVRAFIAVGIASVLCFGSFEVATAVTSKSSSLSASQAIQACATGGGFLRLASASGKCPSGTTKIGLARPSIAPKAMAIDTTSGAQIKSLSLLASTKLVADSSASATRGVLDSVCSLTVAHAGKTQIDGTSFLTRTSGAIASFNGNMTPVGADSVYSPVAGTFDVAAEGNSDFSTLNLHLLVTVPGAVFTIDAIIDANAVTGYCRITAEVESAAT